MLDLPLLNVRLQTCYENWQDMSPVEQGHHCATCNRVVIDFTQARRADLASAFHATSDGRVCGRFRQEQLAPFQLRPSLQRFLLALVLVCGLGLSASEAVAQVKNPKPSPTSSTPQVFGMVAEIWPTYTQGGTDGLRKYLMTNTHYPAEAKANGKVFVSFTIMKNGQVTDIKVIKGLEPLLNAEAVRVVRQMGPWSPGLQQGRPVDVNYTVPVFFQRK
ncbi:energy transducer TonB [Hymenobacter sp. DG25A]|uniref:energy transducer TonB n=1 Tax=Hymenobacter sp. DG25A TaxID=1385663 RepID=UPI0006C8E585|nr:energy transducer TonB [Hymenobacter sp. DG25A]